MNQDNIQIKETIMIYEYGWKYLKEIKITTYTKKKMHLSFE